MGGNGLEYFKKTGFFDQKDEALSLLKDADEILTAEGVDYCLMFGTLLGLLRHGDFIPWDDDLDIIIFDIERFDLISIFTIGDVTVCHRTIYIQYY